MLFLRAALEMRTSSRSSSLAFRMAYSSRQKTLAADWAAFRFWGWVKVMMGALPCHFWLIHFRVSQGTEKTTAAKSS